MGKSRQKGTLFDEVRRVWRGEASLLLTYWLWGVGGNFVLATIAALVPRPNVALSVVAGLYLVFVLIAIVRSTNNYKGPAIWANLARLVVVLAVLRIGSELYSMLQN